MIRASSLAQVNPSPHFRHEACSKALYLPCSTLTLICILREQLCQRHLDESFHRWKHYTLVCIPWVGMSSFRQIAACLYYSQGKESSLDVRGSRRSMVATLALAPSLDLSYPLSASSDSRLVKTWFNSLPATLSIEDRSKAGSLTRLSRAKWPPGWKCRPSVTLCCWKVRAPCKRHHLRLHCRLVGGCWRPRLPCQSHPT